MKEELTTKMHSEFTISAETEVKHRVFTLLTVLGSDNIFLNPKFLYYANLYNVKIEDVKKHIDEFDELNKKTGSL